LLGFLVDSFLSIVLIRPKEFFISSLTIDVNYSLNLPDMRYFLSPLSDRDWFLQIIKSDHELILWCFGLGLFRFKLIQNGGIINYIPISLCQAFCKWIVVKRKFEGDIVYWQSIHWIEPVECRIFVSQKLRILLVEALVF